MAVMASATDIMIYANGAANTEVYTRVVERFAGTPEICNWFTAINEYTSG